ncbi:MAG: FkbM family methyltransferase [Actinobacteria bacterium]|nr:FkbM family methyltransferase [Actinomycetota bacterium]
MARASARTKPLAPRPGWRFDIDYLSDDPGTTFRRRIWERFSHAGVASDVVVPWYDGLHIRLFLGNDLSKCLYVAGEFEPNELSFLARWLEPGMVVLDAGANDGLYTILAANRVRAGGRVVAIEPSVRERRRLEANVRLNSLEDLVTVLPYALYDRSGTGKMAIAELGHEGQNTVGQTVSNPKVGAEREEQVALRTLDEVAVELHLSRLDFLKLDVEGCEARVLRGGAQALARFRPLIQLEAEPDALAVQGSSVQDIEETLASLNYVIYEFSDETGELERTASAADGGNFVAAPAELDLFGQLPEEVRS